MPQDSGNLIVTQTLGVSWHRDPAGREALIYNRAPLAWEDVGPPADILPIDRWHLVEQDIQRIRVTVERLIERACFRAPRGPLDVEADAGRLARRIVPPQGFVGMFEAGVHPQFDSVYDAASLIPWEAFEESYLRCPDAKCRELWMERGARPDKAFCRRCGHEMTAEGGKLALSYHLTHLIRGSGRQDPVGNEFLFIADPTEDLCASEVDPDGVCATHVDRLIDLLSARGFRPTVLRGAHANLSRTLNALARPEVAGVYYFGHGFFPRGGDQGCLMLSDGPLYAAQVEEVAPSARMVFLNACHGADPGREWDLEQRARSVAQAFAQGNPHKVIVAPLWPVVNVQAARSATLFFEAACDGAPLAEAIRRARADSYDKYAAGDPDIGWMAYRYFGEPNRVMPEPDGAGAVDSTAKVHASATVDNLFDGDGGLDLGRYAFPMDEVLLRAAKRRNLQGRALITPLDLLCGLVRRGDLTRHALIELGQAPDRLYERLLNHPEPESETNAPPEAPETAQEQDSTGMASLHRAVRRWIVRQREDFQERTLETLAKAGRDANPGKADATPSPVSEEAVLQALTRSEEWGAWLASGLPPASAVQEVLQVRNTQGIVDANGHVSLAELDPRARRIIETAHELAQQSGNRSITHRLLMAAFLANGSGHAAQCCRATGADPKLVFFLMLGMTQARPADTFGLGLEACRRAVIPLLAEARRSATAGTDLTEMDLFQAFSRMADPQFKALLRAAPMLFDLDAAARHSAKGETLPPQEQPDLESGLDDRVRSILRKAEAYARRGGSRNIRSPHLFAAMLDEGALNSDQLPPVARKKLLKFVLGLVPAAPEATPPAGALPPSPNVQTILARTRDQAERDEANLATPKHLVEAFFADGGGVVGQLLRHITESGMSLPHDLDSPNRRN